MSLYCTFTGFTLLHGRCCLYNGVMIFRNCTLGSHYKNKKQCGWSVTDNISPTTL